MDLVPRIFHLEVKGSNEIFLRNKVFNRNMNIKLRDPLTIKGLNRTNRTFTTKLYPQQYDYCISYKRAFWRTRESNVIKKIGQK